MTTGEFVMKNKEMNASKDINKILNNAQQASSRSHSMDMKIVDNSLYKKETPEFLRIMDKPNYQNIIHRDPNGEP